MRPRRLFAALQLLLAIRVFARMAKSATGARIEPAPEPQPGRITVIVPVLNEQRRLAPCLDGLRAQSATVVEIIVVDGGSTDGTVDLVRRFAELDARIRLVEAGPAPDGVNGKAHNLVAGSWAASATSDWLLTIDADVRPKPGLADALLATAARERVRALSAATTQRVADRLDGAIHPSMLTTLVYRFGIPGQTTIDPTRVQANGQCMLLARSALERVGGFDRVLDTICEDVTLARSLAAAGEPVGFYEAGDLVDVEMYESWRETWQNWPRSLPMRDRFFAAAGWIGLLEITLVQALPLWIALLGRRMSAASPLIAMNTGLLAARIGVLAGTRRAYRQPPATYWLSPLADLPAALALWRMTFKRAHIWRGRPINRGENA